MGIYIDEIYMYHLPIKKQAPDWLVSGERTCFLVKTFFSWVMGQKEQKPYYLSSDPLKRNKGAMWPKYVSE